MNQSTFILHALPKISMRGKKRVGRGYGSGKGGHTSGRGQKGQKSRRTIPWSFEGGALPLSRRLPFMRGKGRLHSLKQKPVILNIGDFEQLKDGTVVDRAFLEKEGYIDQSQATVRGVKILGRGKLTKKLTIYGLSVSAPARSKIEKAGGKIEEKVEMARTVKMAEKAEKKKSAEQKTVKKQAVKKPAPNVIKKVLKKAVLKKRSKKSSK